MEVSSLTPAGRADIAQQPLWHTLVQKIMALLLLIACCLPAHTQSTSSFATNLSGPQPITVKKTEEVSKAASLLNFLGYAEWPEGTFGHASAPYRVGVLGDDVLLKELQGKARNRQLEGRAVEVLRLTASSPAVELNSLHLLFVSKSHNNLLPRVTRMLARRPVLLISESRSGLQLGSVINIQDVSDKVSFKVSLPAAQYRSIVLSSRMLAIADSVQAELP